MVKRPNFVFIMTDTQGANVVGAYGHPDMKTPSIDSLMLSGVRFERAYTTCPLCTPARAGIFSGIYAHSSGAWTNNLPLGSNVLTMGQRLRDVGYRTAYIGKWHLDGHDYFGTGRCPEGWSDEYWYDGARYLSELTDDETILWRKGLRTIGDLEEHDVTREFTWAHRLSDSAIGFLQNKGDRPFLLVVSYDEPHHPWTCPAEYASQFENYRYPIGSAANDDLRDKPALQREWAESSNLDDGAAHLCHPLYFGCNSFVDSEIGRVVKAVDQYAPDDTYVIYTSDHGDMMHGHRLTNKGPAMYEEITHIPLVIRQPGGRGAGRSVATPVSHVDLLPTMLELANLPSPPILEGISLIPLVEGDGNLDRDVFIEFHRYEIDHDSWGGLLPIRCIVSGKYKLAINLLDTDELYDLERDPAELENLIHSPGCAHVRDELHDRLLAWMHEVRDPFRGPAWERRPWRGNRRLTWHGLYRPRPADGYAPMVRDYDSGLRTVGVHFESG